MKTIVITQIEQADNEYMAWDLVHYRVDGGVLEPSDLGHFRNRFDNCISIDLDDYDKETGTGIINDPGFMFEVGQMYAIPDASQS